MIAVNLMRCFMLLIPFFAWLMVVLLFFRLSITRKMLKFLLSISTMSLSKSRVRLNGLLRRNPEIQPLIDDFGLMLRDEYDERSSLSVACYFGLYRWHSCQRYDPRDYSPYYRPRNIFAGFGYEPPRITAIVHTGELASKTTVQLELF